jgi:hypothetical protein
MPAPFVRCVYPRAKKAFRYPCIAHGQSNDPSKIKGVLHPHKAGQPDENGTLKQKGTQWTLSFDPGKLTAGDRYDLIVTYDDGTVKLTVTVKDLKARPKAEKLPAGFEISSPAEGATVPSHMSLVATGNVDNNKVLNTATLEYLNAEASFSGEVLDAGTNTTPWVASFSCPGMLGNQRVRLTVTDTTPRTDSREFTVTDGEIFNEAGD